MLYYILSFSLIRASNCGYVKQVMVGIYGLCCVWGEPLAQTAQSFMPPLLYGSQKNLTQVIYYVLYFHEFNLYSEVGELYCKSKWTWPLCSTYNFIE